MLDFQTQTLITTIGWALVHFLWQGTLITLAYWVITRSIESIHIKYWTGMSLVIFSLIVPIININSNSVVSSPNEILTPLFTSVVSHQQLSFEGLFFYFINACLPFIVFIWAFTVILLSVRLIRSWLKLAAIKHQCDPQVSNDLKTYIKKIAIKLDLPVIPFLKISKQVMVPAAYGVLKPTVLLPLSLLNQIPRNQLEAIIKHELCHLKRNDFIHNIIQLFADIVLFFHPGIRWMNNDIRHVREQCCDQMVLSHDTETLTYAKALTNIAAYTNGIHMKHSVHLGINDGMLLNRVKFLLQNKSSQSSLMVFLPFLLLIIFVMLLLQPNQDSFDSSSINQSTSQQSYLLDENPLSSSQNKRMENQQFYPSLKATEASPAKYSPETKPNTTLNTVVESIAPDINLNKNTRTKELLQAELTQEMQTLNTSTNLFSEEMISSLEPAIQGNSDSQNQEKNALKIEQLINTEDSIETLKISQQTSGSIALESFNVVDPISLSFKQYVAPKYPQNYWYKQIEQDVITTFKILPNGRVSDASFTSQKNNFVAFEQAVAKAMKNWRFETNSLNSATLQRTYQQIFSFSISEDIQNCNQKSTGTRLGRSMPCNN